MALCKNCGAQLNPGSKFCRNCGAKAPVPFIPEETVQSTSVKKEKAPRKKGFTWNIKTRIIAAAMAPVLLFTAFISPGFPDFP